MAASVLPIVELSSDIESDSQDLNVLSESSTVIVTDLTSSVILCDNKNEEIPQGGGTCDTSAVPSVNVTDLTSSVILCDNLTDEEYHIGDGLDSFAAPPATDTARLDSLSGLSEFSLVDDECSYAKPSSNSLSQTVVDLTSGESQDPDVMKPNATDSWQFSSSSGFDLDTQPLSMSAGSCSEQLDYGEDLPISSYASRESTRSEQIPPPKRRKFTDEERLEKELQRLKDREIRKQQILEKRLAKQAEKQRLAEIARTEREALRKLTPEQFLEHLLVVVSSPCVVEFLPEQLRECGLNVRVENQPESLLGTILWRWADGGGRPGGDKQNGPRFLRHIVLLLNAVELCSMVRGSGSGVSALSGRVLRAQAANDALVDSMPSHSTLEGINILRSRCVVVVIGLEAQLKREFRAVSRELRDVQRRNVSNPSYHDANIGEILQSFLVRLSLETNCSVKHTCAAADTAKYILKLGSTFNTVPYRDIKELPFCPEAAKITPTPNKTSDIWVYQLACLPGVSLQMARGVAEVYPTFQALRKAYSALHSTEAKKSLLSTHRFRTQSGGFRNFGPLGSSRVYCLFATDADPNQLCI